MTYIYRKSPPMNGLAHLIIQYRGQENEPYRHDFVANFPSRIEICNCFEAGCEQSSSIYFASAMATYR